MEVLLQGEHHERFRDQRTQTPRKVHLIWAVHAIIFSLSKSKIAKPKQLSHGKCSAATNQKFTALVSGTNLLEPLCTSMLWITSWGWEKF